MRTAICVMAALSVLQATQVEPAAPRTTTERPNVSAPGLEKTMAGVIMDAACPAIADARSELTKTPRLVEKSRSAPIERRATERTQPDVPEKYNGCKLKSSSTSYAVYTNGRVYMFDRISNQMMQEHMAKEAANDTNWIVRTVVGTTTSDDVLTLRTVRK